MDNFTLNCQSLTIFRAQIYDAFTRAADSLMNTADALLTQNHAQSLPELSLSPFFTRKWHSLYEAFQDGRIDTDKLRHTFANNAPTKSKKRICMATDVSSIARPKSKTRKAKV
jgi:hypothetical protein